MHRNTYGQAGFAHIVGLLMVLAAVVIGAVFVSVSRQDLPSSDTGLTTAAQRVKKEKKIKTRLYFTNTEVKMAKQAAYDFWSHKYGDLCRKGKGMKVKTSPASRLQARYQDNPAYAYIGSANFARNHPNYCRIVFNTTAINSDHSKHKPEIKSEPYAMTDNNGYKLYWTYLRFCKTMVHEYGHVYGVGHNSNPLSIMYGDAARDDLDAKGRPAHFQSKNYPRQCIESNRKVQELRAKNTPDPVVVSGGGSDGSETASVE